MVNRNLKKTITAVLTIVIVASLLGCGPQKTPLTENNKPALSPAASVELSPGLGTDATSGATIEPAQAPSPTVDATSSATMTASAGEPADAVSSATLSGDGDEEDDD